MNDLVWSASPPDSDGWYWCLSRDDKVILRWFLAKHMYTSEDGAYCGFLSSYTHFAKVLPPTIKKEPTVTNEFYYVLTEDPHSGELKWYRYNDAATALMQVQAAQINDYRVIVVKGKPLTTKTTVEIVE